MRLGHKKDKFADLDSDFKDAVAGMNEAEIRDRIAKISLDQAALLEAKANDIDLKTKREEANVAGAIYREGSKMNRLRIEYVRRVLDDKGKEAGSFEQAA